MKRIALFLSVGAIVMLLASVAMAQPPKVDVCHVPPGNPENVQLISVSVKSVPAHAAHGDFAVGCFGCDGSCCFDEECTAPGECTDASGNVFTTPCGPQ